MTEPMARGVSVVVCCHNSAAVLPETLAHLARQRVPESMAWEVVLVDNASTDATAAVARAVWSEQGGEVPFRVVREPEPGLVAARNAGARSAAFEYVLYCDDDNRLDPQYVRRVHEIMDGAPQIGVLGGWGEPDFERHEPGWFGRYSQYYATGPQAEASGDVTDTKGFVYGAGFALRRSMWMEILDQGFDSPLGAYERGSNDIEVCYLMRLAGARIWYDERLRFRHYLPARRLSWDAFLDLVENAHLTGVYMAPYRHVLRAMDSAEGYRRPSRLHWLARAASVGRRWLLARAVAARHRAKDAHPTELRARRLRGSWKGWAKIRGRHAELCDRIEHVRRGLQATELGGSD